MEKSKRQSTNQQTYIVRTASDDIMRYDLEFILGDIEEANGAEIGLDELLIELKEVYLNGLVLLKIFCQMQKLLSVIEI